MTPRAPKPRFGWPMRPIFAVGDYVWFESEEEIWDGIVSSVGELLVAIADTEVDGFGTVFVLPEHLTKMCDICVSDSSCSCHRGPCQQCSCGYCDA